MKKYDNQRFESEPGDNKDPQTTHLVIKDANDQLLTPCNHQPHDSDLSARIDTKKLVNAIKSSDYQDVKSLLSSVSLEELSHVEFVNDNLTPIEEDLGIPHLLCIIWELQEECFNGNELLNNVCASLKTFKTYTEHFLIKRGISHHLLNFVFFKLVAEKYDELMDVHRDVSRTVFKEIEVPLTRLLIPLVEYSRFRSMSDKLQNMKMALLNQNDYLDRSQQWNEIKEQVNKVNEMKTLFGTYCFGKVHYQLLDLVLKAFEKLKIEIDRMSNPQATKNKMPPQENLRRKNKENETQVVSDGKSPIVNTEPNIGQDRDIQDRTRKNGKSDTELKVCRIQKQKTYIKQGDLVKKPEVNNEKQYELVSDDKKTATNDQTNDNNVLKPEIGEAKQMKNPRTELNQQKVMDQAGYILGDSNTRQDSGQNDKTSHEVPETRWKPKRKAADNDQHKNTRPEPKITTDNATSTDQDLCTDLYTQLKDIGTLGRILYYIEMTQTFDLTHSGSNNENLSIAKLVFERALQVTGEYSKVTDETPHLSKARQKMLQNAGVPIDRMASLRNLLSHCSTLFTITQGNEISCNLLKKVQDDLGKIKRIISKLLRKLEFSQLKTLLREIPIDFEEDAACDNEAVAKIKVLLLQVDACDSQQQLKCHILEICAALQKECGNGRLQEIKEAIDEILIVMKLREFDQIMNIHDISKSNNVRTEETQNSAMFRILGYPENDSKSSITRMSSIKGIVEYHELKSAGYKNNTGQHGRSLNLEEIFQAKIMEQLAMDKDFKNLLKKPKFGFDSDLRNYISKAKTSSFYLDMLRAVINQNFPKEEFHTYLSKFIFEPQTEESLFQLMTLKKDYEKPFQTFLNDFHREVILALNSINALNNILGKAMDVAKQQLMVAEFDQLESQIKSKQSIHFAKYRLELLCNGIGKLSKTDFDGLVSQLESPEKVKQWAVYHSNRQGCKNALIRNVSDPYDKVLKALSGGKGFSDTIANFQEFVKTLQLGQDCANCLNQIFAEEVEKHFDRAFLDNILVLKECMAGLVMDAKNPTSLNYKNDATFAALKEMLVLKSMTTLKEISSSVVFWKLESLIQDSIVHLDDKTIPRLNKSLRNYLAHGDVLTDTLNQHINKSVTCAAEILAQNGNALLEIKKMLSNPGSTIILLNFLGDHLHADLMEFMSDAHKNQINTIKESIYWQNKQCKVELFKLISETKVLQDTRDTRNFSLDLFTTTIQEEFETAIQSDKLKSTKFLYHWMKMMESDFSVSSPLHIAADNGSTEVMSFLLDQGLNVNATCPYGSTPLHRAVINGHIRSTKCILEKGADVDFADGQLRGPLHLATMFGHPNIIRLLIQYGAGTENKDKIERRSIHIAAIYGQIQSILALYENGAELDASDRKLITPLFLAVFNGHHDIVEMLLKAGANTCGDIKCPFSPMDAAIETGDLRMVKLLISFKANVNRSNQREETPLHLACSKKNSKIVDELIIGGANLNSLNECNMTPLQIAMEYENVEVARSLIDGGARIESMDVNGWNAMHFAAFMGQLGIIELLVEAGLDIDQAVTTGHTPFFIATQRGHADVAKYLLQKDANVNVTVSVPQRTGVSHDSWPLLYIILKEKFELVDLLLEFGADVNKTGHTGATVLHYAIQQCNLDVVSKLIEKNADVNAPDSAMSRPLHRSVRIGNAGITEYLLKHGADVNEFSWRRIAAIHLAAISNHPNAVQLLIDHGAELNVLDDEECTALNYAIKYGQLEAMACLLKNGCDVNLRGYQLKTALHLACAMNSADYDETSPNDGFHLERTTKIKMLQMLIKYKAKVDVADAFNFTPAHYLKKVGDGDLMNILLEQRTGHEHVAAPEEQTKAVQQDVDFENTQERSCSSEASTPMPNDCSVNINVSSENVISELHNAVKAGQLYSVKKLLAEHHGRINAAEVNERQFLQISTANGYLEIVEELVKSNLTDVNHLGNKDNFMPLHLAVNIGDDRIVNFLLKNGAYVNSCSRIEMQAALHLAVLKGNLAIAQMLLENQETIVDVKDVVDETPLFFACRNGQADMMTLLISKGAEINLENKDGNGLIHEAILSNHAEIVETLLELDLDVNKAGKDGNTPLHVSIRVGRMDIVQMLMIHDATVNCVNTTEETPLHIAAQNGHCNIVEFLLRIQDVNINSITKNKDTPLHLAAEMGHTDVVRILTHSSTSINTRNKQNLTPLHIAASHGFFDIAVLLLQGASVIDGEAKHEALLLAAEEGYDSIALLLLEHNADVNAMDKGSQTVIHKAMLKSNTAFLQELLERGADIDCSGNDGKSPLHLAVISRFDDGVKVLIEKGANMDVVDQEGQTPLLTACEYGFYDIAQCLIIAGANVNIANAGGMLPLFLATKHGMTKTVEFLLYAGADINAVFENTNTALHIAILNMFDDIVELLLKSGTDITFTLKDGLTYLHFGSMFGNAKIVKILLEHGLFVNARTTSGVTPLHGAAQGGLAEIIAVLLESGADVNAEASRINVNSDNFILNKDKSCDTQGPSSGSGVTGLQQANANGTSRKSLTALHLTSEIGHEAATLVLIKNGANVNALDSRNNTPLHCASKEGHLRIVQALLREKASRAQSQIRSDINSVNADNRTPLALAVMNEHEETAMELIKMGADIHSSADGTMSLLYLAAMHQQTMVVQHMLENGADAQLLLESDESAFNARSSLESKKLLNFMINLGKGAKPLTNSVIKDGSSVFYNAKHLGRACVVFKLSLPPDPGNVPTDKSIYISLHFVALFKICKFSDDEPEQEQGVDGLIITRTKSLILHGGKVFPEEEFNHSALHVAAIHGFAELANLLLDDGGINFKDEKQDVTLRMAVLSHSQEAKTTIQERLRSKLVSETKSNIEDINNSGKDGNTALAWGTVGGHLDVVGILMKHGANIGVKNHEGQTPLDIACLRGQTAVVSFLLDNGANACDRNNHDTVLHLAVSSGVDDIIRLILNKMRESLESEEEFLQCIDAKDTEGDTPLMWAAESGHVGAASVLLSYGANINAKNNIGMTAMDWAKQTRHEDVAAMIVQHVRAKSTSEQSVVN